MSDLLVVTCCCYLLAVQLHSFVNRVVQKNLQAPALPLMAMTLVLSSFGFKRCRNGAETVPKLCPASVHRRLCV